MHLRLRSAWLGAGLILAPGAPLPAQTPGNWETVGTPGLSAGQAVCCQITFDPRGRPCIAYQDQTAYSGHAIVQRFEGASWVSLGTPGQASLGIAWYDLPRFDTTGNLYLASRDYQVSGALSVRLLSEGGSTWSSVGPNAASLAEAHYTSLALDATGVPYTCYSDRGATPREGPSVAHFDAASGSWELVGPRGISGNASSYNTLAFDSQGVLYAAFADRGQLDALGAPKATVLRWDVASSTWMAVGAPGFSPQGVANLVLAIDHQDRLYAAYYRYHDKLVVMRFDGTNWLQLGGSASGTDRPAVESEGWRQWLSLCFDSQDLPYIAYELFDDGLRAAVRRYAGTSWELVGPAGFTSDVADYLSLAIDPSDVPYVVFVDGSQARRVSVMRYAPSPCGYGAPSPNSRGCAFAIGATGTASLSAGTPFPVQASGVASHSPGVLLWSHRPAHIPFAGGAALLAGPVHRSALLDSGGTPGVQDCSGALSVDFSAILSAGNSGFSAGEFAFAQYWYLDPGATDGSALSAGLRFRIDP